MFSRFRNAVCVVAGSGIFAASLAACGLQSIEQPASFAEQGIQDASGLTSDCTGFLASTTDPGSMVCNMVPVNAAGSSVTINANNPRHAVARQKLQGNTGLRLLVMLNGSMGSPTDAATASMATDTYTAAVSLNYNVIGLSYRSKEAIHGLCGAPASPTPEQNDQANRCYPAARKTIITGVITENTPPALSGAGGTGEAMTEQESIEYRLVHLLKYLSSVDTAGNWGNFLTGGQVSWAKVVVLGSSQGGGHALMLSKLHPVARTVMLSSVCDFTGSYATTDNRVPATWITATPSSGSLRGLGSQYDSICHTEEAAWLSLGMVSGAHYSFLWDGQSDPHSWSHSYAPYWAPGGAGYVLLQQ